MARKMTRGSGLLLLMLAVTLPAGALPPTAGRSATDYQRLLGRPYGAFTPMPGTGANLWVTHPRVWGFATDVNYFHLDLMEAYRLRPTWDGEPVAFGASFAHLGHLESQALPPGDLALNRSGFGLPRANTDNGPKHYLVDGSRAAWSTVFHAQPGGSGIIPIEVEWAVPVRVATLLLSLVEDPALGLALPRALRVEFDDGSGYRPVNESSRAPIAPAAGANRISFDPVDALRLRALLSSDVAIGVSEIEAYAPGIQPLELSERKVVREDDVLVSELWATNLGDRRAALAIVVASDRVALDQGQLRGEATLHAMPVVFRLDLGGSTLSANQARLDLDLAPGARARAVAAMPFARSAAEADARLAQALASSDPAAEADASAARWLLEQLPVFATPDPWFEKMFAFRGALVRRSLGDPRFGPLQRPALSEGRWALPWYARPITFGAPHQLREARWLGDGEIARDHALNFIEQQRADGAFVGLETTGANGNEYVEWLGAAVAEVFSVTDDTDLLARARVALSRNVDRFLARDGDLDLLPEQADHYMTGMEWQPSFFWFSGYDSSRPETLERVEDAVALAAVARAAARAAAALCDPPEASRLEDLAIRVAAAIEAKMWDANRIFYYPNRASDDARAEVREIAAFYPFAFGLAPAAHDPALAALFDVSDFASRHGPASSSLGCPATSQDGWPIGPGGSYSMWNGPTWPHSSAIAIEAAARTHRRSGETVLSRSQLFSLLESYTHAQFEGNGAARDFAQPMVGEAYRGDDGRWKTDERDYFHSTWIDLVIRFLVGLEPASSGVTLDPLLPPGQWDRFLLEGLRFRGHRLHIAWDAGDGIDHFGDGREGFDLWVDGELVAARPDLGPLSAPLPAAQLLLARDPAGFPVLTRVPSPRPWSAWRSLARDFRAPQPVASDRVSGPSVVDRDAPQSSLVYYRAGACGPGH